MRLLSHDESIKCWDFYRVTIEKKEKHGRIKNENRKLVIAPKYKGYSFYKICFKKENCTEIEGSSWQEISKHEALF